jgi:hypothetical protein
MLLCNEIKCTKQRKKSNHTCTQHTKQNFLLIVHDVQSEMKIKHSLLHNADNHMATRMCAHV